MSLHEIFTQLHIDLAKMSSQENTENASATVDEEVVVEEPTMEA